MARIFSRTMFLRPWMTLSIVLLLLSTTPQLLAQKQRKGTPGVITRHDVVNFSQLARGSADSAAARSSYESEERSIEAPRSTPDNFPVATWMQQAAKAEIEPLFPKTPQLDLDLQAFSPVPATNFSGITDTLNFIPPDTHGAVGPSHIVITVNGAVRITDRSGSFISQVTLDDFWSLPFSATFDPKVLYDPYSDRWMIVTMANAATASSSTLLAVSQTGDPTGTWNRITIDADVANTNWADYPGIGFNKNWIVVTVNMFGNADNVFSGSRIYVFNKAATYANTPTYVTFVDIVGSIAPAATYDNSVNSLYMANLYNSGLGYVQVSSISGTPTEPVLNKPDDGTTGLVTGGLTWTSSGAAGADFAPQSGTSSKTQTNDARVQNTVYRNGSVWFTQTVHLPTGAPTRAAVQWWQVNPSDFSLTQFGRIDDSSGVNFYAFPSIAVNKFSDVLIGYSSFSANQFNSANYSLRFGTDASNTMQSDYRYKAGLAPYFKTLGSGKNRWGDYSATVVDPVNDTDMWVQQEYADLPSGSDRWGTWWAKVGLELTATPAALNFGNVSTAQDSTIDVTFTNRRASTVSITVGTTDDFSFVNDCGPTVSASVSCTIHVTFAPGTLGPHSGNLTITPTTGSAVTVPLSGTGIALQASPVSLSFPDTVKNQNSTAQDVTFTNNTGSTISLSVQISGDYSITNNTCAATLANAASCVISARFTPTALGVRNGSLTITPTPGEDVVVPLTGHGIEVSTSPTSLNFTKIGIGTTSNPQNISVTNSTNNAITFTLGVTGDFEVAIDTCAGNIAAGVSCNLIALFKPTAEGTRNGELTITPSQGNVNVLSLSGQAGTLTPSPSGLTFPGTFTGQNSNTQDLTITNGTGSATTITYGLTGDFQFAENNCTGNLNDAVGCTVVLRFSPTASGSRTGTLTLTPASGTPVLVSLSGTGYALDASPANLTFLAQAVGVNNGPLQVVTVTNNSNVTLNIGSSIGGDFTIDSTTCGSSLTAGASCNVSVRFIASALGVRNSNLVVTPSQGLPASIPLSGTGVTIDTTPASLSFGAGYKNINTTGQNVSVTNNTGSPVTIATGISGDFNISSNTCVGSIATGNSCQVSVRLLATVLGARAGTLTLTPTPGTAVLIGLSGTGVQVTPTPTTLAFGTQIIKRTMTKTLSLQNNTLAPISFTFSASGDFGYVSGCTGSIAVGASCSPTISFTPSQGNARNGTLTVTSSPSYPIPGIPLSGTGFDFTMVLARPNRPLRNSIGGGSIAAGESATYSFAVAASTEVDDAVQFACSGAPAGTTCSVTPNGARIGRAPVTVQVTLQNQIPGRASRLRLKKASLVPAVIKITATINGLSKVVELPVNFETPR